MAYGEIGQYIDLGFFSWRRSDAGYQIKATEPVLAEGKSDLFVLEKTETTGYQVTRPLENKVLFRAFGDLDGSPESFIEFANENGLLTQGESLATPPVNGACDRTVRGDRLSLWTDEHWILQRVLETWDWLRAGDLENLQNVILWTSSGTVKYFFAERNDLKSFRTHGAEIVNGALRRRDNGARLRIMEGEFDSPGLIERFVRGDVILPAQTAVQLLVNRQLSKHPVRPMLLMDKKNALKQYFVPENLLAAMWFQLFQGLSGERKFKKCSVCHLWEDVTEKRANWSRHPECAGRIRTRKYREKLKEAAKSGEKG
jgi:hypothetical protein